MRSHRYNVAGAADHPESRPGTANEAATIDLPTVKSSGLFITFEGMDGSGKTTQMHRLAAHLRSLGHSVLETAEPGGPPVAMQIRRILLDSDNTDLSPTAEVLLYFASRAQNVDQWILPALAPRRDRPLRPLYRFLPGLPGCRTRPRRRCR